MIEPTTLAASRVKTLAYLAIGLGFVAIALFLPHDGGDDTWRWLDLGFFGLCSAVFAVLLARPQRVELDGDGFTVAGGLARTARHVAWRDVDRFFVYRLPRGGRKVGYRLVPRARPDSYLGDLNRRVGVDGILPGTLAGSPDAIADTLNRYREAAAGRHP